MSMGGGGGGGGTAVPYISPEAAQQVGQYQVEAANEAARIAEKSINDAIRSLNSQYYVARNDLRPYRMESISALNQLNQYIGLPAYDPGYRPNQLVKPTAPKGKSVSPGDLASIIAGNGVSSQYGTVSGLQNIANNNSTVRSLIGASVTPNGGVGNLSASDLSSMLKNDPNKYNTLAREIAGGGVSPEAQAKYEQDLANYNNDYLNNQNDLAEYDYAKNLQNQYNAQGPLTQQQISDRISNLPGYQAQLEQGSNAISKSGAAKGYLGSGRLLKELADYGQNTFSTFYGDTLSRLANLVGMGQQSATQSAQLASNQGSNLASLKTMLGDSKANAALAAGQARSSAYQLGNTSYKVIGQQEGSGLGGLGSLLGGIGGLASGLKPGGFL